MKSFEELETAKKLKQFRSYMEKFLHFKHVWTVKTMAIEWTRDDTALKHLKWILSFPLVFSCAHFVQKLLNASALPFFPELLRSAKSPWKRIKRAEWKLFSFRNKFLNDSSWLFIIENEENGNKRLFIFLFDDEGSFESFVVTACS